MRKLFKNKAALWLIVLVIILGIAVGILNATKNDTTIFENVTNIIVTPVQKLFTNIGHGVSDFFGYFSDVDKLRTEIDALKAENSELKKEINQNESSRLENEQLRKLLNMKQGNTEFELEAASVIARNPSNWYNTFTIDKGAADGIALNQPVVASGNALVGRISEVGTTWSTVSVITDSEHAAGAQIVRSGEFGICEGDSGLAADGNLRLSFVSKNANIIVGDTVVTSGLGGIYPKGLVIGKIYKIRPDIQGISQYAVITPETDIKNLCAVFVIKNPLD
ncbi:MAG: rod shape-determining protein MreC [Clostridia bacterium]|nr:rod shape-determining protein MreC [Clostridia bacterium]